MRAWDSGARIGAFGAEHGAEHEIAETGSLFWGRAWGRAWDSGDRIAAVGGEHGIAKTGSVPLGQSMGRSMG